MAYLNRMAGALLLGAMLAHTSLAHAQAPARAGRHALIVAVGDYLNPAITPLKGTGHDVASASQIAAAMQVPPQNIRVLRDHEATAGRIEQEILALNQRTQPGDRVFFYFTGHGSRYLDTTAAQPGCVEALLPADSRPLTNERLANLFKPIADKADKLFVFYDACHSGGVVGRPLSVTRSLNAGTLSPKFSPAGAPDACARPSNIRTRSLAGEAARSGILPQNMVLVSSSRPDEVSFDDAHAGGVATQAWRQCMLQSGRDLDQSGALSVNEIMACAQEQIDARFTGDSNYSSQHMTVGGNAGFVPGWFAGAASALAQASPGAPATPLGEPTAAAPVAPAPAPPSAAPSAPLLTLVAAPTPAPPPAAPQSAPQSAPLAAAPGAALADVLAQSDPRRKVSVTAPSKVLRIGKDTLDLSITSSHAGHVYIVLLGTDNRSYYMLFPNDRDTSNRINAGETLKLPRPNWRITAQGPAGTDRMLVLVTETARDLSLLGGAKAGPFVHSLSDADGRARLQWLLGTSANLASAECAAGAAARDASRAARCSDAFGAVLAEFTEQ